MSLELALKGLIAEVLAEAGVIKSATTASVQPDSATSTTETVAPRRGRGRPVRGEEAAPAVPAAPVATVEAADPFGATPGETAPPVPVATLDEVRTALKALQAATNQASAVALLKATGGVDNLGALTADKYGIVAAAAKAAALAAPQPVTEPADPFGETTPAALPAAKPLTREEVRAEIVATQKRTSVDTIQKLLMQHGGKAPIPGQGGEGPSLKDLPEANFAGFVTALKALPTTK